jgi:hypothetical protein
MTTEDPSIQRVMTRFRRRQAAAKPEDLRPILRQMDTIHGRIRTWYKGFPTALREARKGTDSIPNGWVWQDPFVGFFEGYDPYQKQLFELGQKLKAINTSEAKAAKAAIEPPGGARVNQAIKTIDFATHPETGQDHIIYPEANLGAWRTRFSAWLTKSSTLLKSFL